MPDEEPGVFDGDASAGSVLVVATACCSCWPNAVESPEPGAVGVGGVALAGAGVAVGAGAGATGIMP
ncbi:MAG: hypothetical protein ACRD0Y_01385 [Terriglobales bacterium]